ncbi:hypothetical protein L798_04095 [Zootermopsis nevadensis]|uniref:Uncharacterized protein n=1 Tax=Zootermopsis nevadensis TaxID=136037 RepID=A0A067RKR4_ZOONE|nr:hypothetical protein L798_04095 [Zootermopsis nevadensis]
MQERHSDSNHEIQYINVFKVLHVAHKMFKFLHKIDKYFPSTVLFHVILTPPYSHFYLAIYHQAVKWLVAELLVLSISCSISTFIITSTDDKDGKIILAEMAGKTRNPYVLNLGPQDYAGPKHQTSKELAL